MPDRRTCSLSQKLALSGAYITSQDIRSGGPVLISDEQAAHFLSYQDKLSLGDILRETEDRYA